MEGETTALSQGQTGVRPKGQTTCIYHEGTQLELFCKSCSQVACTKCLTSVHDSHSVCDLGEVTPQQKRVIQHFMDNTEEIVLDQVNRDITSTQKHLKGNSTKFQQLANDLKQQNEKMKQDLDKLLEDSLSEYQQMEKKNAALLNTYKSNLESYKVKLNQLLKECISALQEGTDLDICDIGSEIHCDAALHVPKAPTLGTASFSPNTDPQSLGTVTITDPGHASFAPALHRSISAKGLPLLNQATKIVGVFHSLIISSMCPTGDNNAWTCNSETHTMTLLDRKDTPLQKIEYHSNIRDISLSNNHELWSCHHDHSVAELVSGKPTPRFKVDHEPRCICLTQDGHVIIGMDGSVSKFTKGGTRIRTTVAGTTGKPFVCSPYRITECRVTENVAVADKDNTAHGGDGKPHVVVMDMNFRELFRYKGICSRSSHQTTRPFNPWGVAYDSTGNLVMTDCNNHRVLLIGGDGQFLRTLHNDTWNTRAVGIDANDIVWAAFGWCGEYNVKILQYHNV